tara:strand:+ start:1907 stop:2614 length:708 start_codon:yes stop_codon:yes gene_type:complete
MIRSLIFKIFFYLGLIIVCLIFLPGLILPRRFVLFGGKLLGYWSKICLKFFLSNEIEVIGSENIIKYDKFFIACSHQSMFETFFLQTIFNSPVFILKKELVKVPVFGWYLKKIGSITIERNKVSKENLGFSDKINIAIKNSDRPIIIFPQGTRVDDSYRGPFKKGVSRIYDDLKIKCQPVAINSGSVWPKIGNLNANKKITISILKPIEPNLDGKDFLKILQQNIYSELDKLNLS